MALSVGMPRDRHRSSSYLDSHFVTDENRHRRNDTDRRAHRGRHDQFHDSRAYPCPDILRAQGRTCITSRHAAFINCS